MILAVDARNICRRQRRGTGKNLIDLYRHLAAARPDWRIVMFHQVDGPDDPFAGVANVERRRIDIKGDRWGFWQRLRLPMAVRRVRADVLHCPANTAPRRGGAPMVVTIHDLIPLAGPAGASKAGRRWRANVAAAAARAVAILTPSAFSRQQVVSTFGVSVDKITVNPWAPDTGCRRVTDPAELSRVRSAYGLEADRPYVFGFGGADPRKNTAAVLDAWAAMPGAARGRAALLLVGIQPEALARFRRQAERAGLNGSCRLHGFAAEEDIPALLSGAAALCYPSRSEGFGLPILDAFACGTPVLTGNTTSLPEVAGDAAMQVDPADVRAIADGLAGLLTDPALAAELAARGRRRVEQFTWPACAERAAGVFEKAMESSES